ncbi:AAA family ATPase [Marine Group I thaumarchaeote]|uniref:AAA family ATPase n=1 Tax=Marine Group I thaumarchaeote TaxID=2511932 RepID=A0A7K4NFD9_9ARCH|nr:AAA family ATPase [Marine Group I thaumarchaeote]
MTKLIVCLTGMPGSGKSSIISALKASGLEALNLGDGVRAEAKRRNLEPTGDNLGKLMLELREKNGPGAIAELLTEPIKNSKAKVIVIDGVRSTAEIEVLKNVGSVKLLSIDASTDTRYKFLSARGRSDDPATREKFEERDNRELGVGIGESIAIADETIVNSDITLDELTERAYKVIEKWIGT